MILHYPNVKAAEEASLKRRFAGPGGENLAIVSVLGDTFFMYLDTRDTSLTPHLQTRGIVGPHLLESICGVVTPGMTCADVGAGFGYHTLLLCALAGERGRVYAFEPHPRIYPILKRNIELNKFTQIARPYPNALGASEGDGELAIHKWRFDSATLADRPKASFGSANIAAVHVSRLDDLLSEQSPPDFYLISAVGYEPEVWAGMQGLLAAKRKVVIFMEFTHRWYAAPAKFAADILEQEFMVHRLRDGAEEPLLEPSQFCTRFRSWLKLTR